jgi:prepilin-type N-terminal cleavage/methylation domain-containing protein
MRAFTLIELLLTVAIISLIAIGGVTMHATIVSDRAVRSAVSVSAAAARVAQESARAQYLGDAWGVRISSASATIFRGVDWLGRDQTFDAEYAFEYSVPASTSDIVFRRMTGVPLEARTIVFRRDDTVLELAIDSYGRIITN